MRAKRSLPMNGKALSRLMEQFQWVLTVEATVDKTVNKTWDSVIYNRRV